MSFYEDNWYDITVECRNCHDLYYSQFQLYSGREASLVNELLLTLFTSCHNCGASEDEFLITVSNEYYTPEEYKQLIEDESKKPPMANT